MSLAIAADLEGRRFGSTGVSGWLSSWQGGGAVGWWLAGPLWLGRAYTVVLVVHYALSWDRVAWLLSPDTNVVMGTAADIE